MLCTRIAAIAFLCGGLWGLTAIAQGVPQSDGPIDRHALVSRHDIAVHDIDPAGAMAIRNGEFAFNFDVTGLQSFPEYYEKLMPVGILSNWGWHSFPNPSDFTMEKFKFTTVKHHDRDFSYPASGTNNPPPDAAYLRGNPHRFGLGQIGLEMTKSDGSKVTIQDLQKIEQKVELWSGIVSSSFEVDGSPVHVQTAVHGPRDEVGVRIESPLIAAGRLKVRIAFPYASSSFGPGYEDWSKPDAHGTALSRRGDTGADFARTLDSMHYTVRAKWSSGATLAETGKHQYLLSGTTPQIEITAWFSPKPMEGDADNVADVQTASRDYWKKYWTSGGVIDLSGNEDPRAAELERRIVLSQFLMNVHDSGSYPGAETGLGVNSWFGKYHMEMYWWHAAHWGLWGHADLLEKSLNGLFDMMAAGEAMARLEGCKGVKWSKMTAPNGVESPSGVGPILVWQQPHPIYLAELVYRAKKDRATLEKYKPIVLETADYMATFVDYDPARKQYVLGPAVSSADEGHTKYAENLNPTMELGYFRWAIQTAQEWRTRLGMPPDEQYARVLAGLAPLPVRNGIYPTLEAPVDNGASWMATWLYGVLPGRDVDKDVMRRTLAPAVASRVRAPQTTVTWGIPMVAMCAARMGQPDKAVELLVTRYDEKSNPFRVSGYTVRKPEQTPMYMPANGGWLSAAAMMAAGWDGNTDHAPGFPKSWKVRFEGLQPMP